MIWLPDSDRDAWAFVRIQKKFTTPATCSQVTLTNPPGLREVPARIRQSASGFGSGLDAWRDLHSGQTEVAIITQPYRLQLFWLLLPRQESPCVRVRVPCAERSCGVWWPGFPFSGQVGFVAFPSSIPFGLGLCLSSDYCFAPRIIHRREQFCNTYLYKLLKRGLKTDLWKYINAS